MSDPITALAYTPDGEHILVGVGDRFLRGNNGALVVVNARSLETKTCPLPVSVHHLALRPDGRRVALGTGYGWVYTSAGDWTPGGYQSQGNCATAVAYSPDGQLLAIASGQYVLLQRGEGGPLAGVLRGHTSRVTSLAFTPDGARLLSGSWDRTARLWAPDTGQQLASFDWARGKVQYVAVAPDGMTAAAAMDKGVVLWDLDD